MKNGIKRIAMLAIGVTSVTALASCRGGGEIIVTDPKTINVRLYKRGFGDEFIYELRDKFEALYANEGYKMNVLTPSPDNGGAAMVQEMYSDKSGGVDLYIIGDVTPNMVSELGEYGEVATDIEELVYNKPSIDYSGVEGKTVKELINPDLEQFLRADNGKMYGFAWAQASAGLVVNIQKLKRYGINELPRTSKEFLADCRTIYEKTSDGKTTTLPLTYTIGNTGYSDCAFYQWFAQLGIDKFNEFVRFQTKDGDGWKDMTSITALFEDEDLYESILEAYRFMDPYLAAKGSITQDLDQAQQKMVDNGLPNDAVFMFNGDWFLNEIKQNFPTTLDQFNFINVPVISKVGKNVFCKEPYNKNEEEADALLSYTCKLIDENKSTTDIKADLKTNKGIEISDADLKVICDARGLSYARGPEHLAFIPKKTEKQEIAALALRMMASNDYARTFMTTSNCSTPYATDIKDLSDNTFVNQARDICTNQYFRGVRAYIRGKRASVQMNTFFPGCQYISQEIATASKQATVLDGKGGYNGETDQVYKDAAHIFFEKTKKAAEEAWEKGK